SQDHLDFHSDFDDYFAAKQRLFFELPSTKNIVTVANSDDEYGARLLKKAARPLGFGAVGDVELVAASPGLDALQMTLRVSGTEFEIKAPLGSRFNVENAMAVFSALLALGYSAVDCARALSAVR